MGERPFPPNSLAALILGRDGEHGPNDNWTYSTSKSDVPQPDYSSIPWDREGNIIFSKRKRLPKQILRPSLSEQEYYEQMQEAIRENEQREEQVRAATARREEAARQAQIEAAKRADDLRTRRPEIMRQKNLEVSKPYHTMMSGKLRAVGERYGYYSRKILQGNWVYPDRDYAIYSWLYVTSEGKEYKEVDIPVVVGYRDVTYPDTTGGRSTADISADEGYGMGGPGPGQNPYRYSSGDRGGTERVEIVEDRHHAIYTPFINGYEAALVSYLKDNSDPYSLCPLYFALWSYNKANPQTPEIDPFLLRWSPLPRRGDKINNKTTNLDASELDKLLYQLKTPNYEWRGKPEKLGY